MAHNPFPDPAAVHPGEAEMLAAVVANLTDDLPKLVYADWLEERNDERGPFLREFTTAARGGGKLPEADGLSKVWLDLTGCRAVATAREHELPVTPDELLRDALPALTFTSEPAADADLLIGQSKFGGDPDVPPGFEWPEFRGRQLSFLAQFSLLRLAESSACRELPRDGLLSVFYAEDADVYGAPDVGGWWVVYFRDTGRLARLNSPPDVAEHHYFSPCRLSFTETLMLLERRHFDEAGHRDAYRNEVSNTELGHQLLGHPRWLQGEGWTFGATDGTPNLRHLLTLDSDEKPGWMWGDSGLLYFGISGDDLKAGQFDRTVFEMQCC